jgi:hypothetical protein
VTERAVHPALPGADDARVAAKSSEGALPPPPVLSVAVPAGRAPQDLFTGTQSTVQSLPIGAGDKSGVSSQAIPVPQGAGKIQGMGESFSAQLSTGIATFSVPIALPDARGAAQPALSLSYNSGGGEGLAGFGWDLGVPAISRQTDRGLPLYDDRSAWHPQQDRFVFNGGQELVPICEVEGTNCSGEQPGEIMPAWANGWQYFRSRVEAGYQRFFWSPDHQTWRVQAKSGETLELGLPLDGTGYAGALETDPSNKTHVFRWNLARQYDNEGSPPPAGATQPAPVNAIVYCYESAGGTDYLTDSYDTSPRGNPVLAPLSQYAHHTRPVYETRPDTTFSYRRGWRVDQTLRLVGIDVASIPFAGVSGAATTRHQVRRYHLTYDANYHVSLLTSVHLEGRCAGSADGETSAPAEDPSSEGLPDATNCPTLPPIALGYHHVTPYKVDGSAATADLPGYEGFDERLLSASNSPPNSIDESNADLVDINSYGLPDLVTTPLIVDTQALNAGGAPPLAGKLARGNYNYRHVNVAVNLVGAGVRDCTNDPTPDCYATGYVEYDLAHDGRNAGIADYNGNTRYFDFGVASIQHGKALAAERYITVPVGANDQSLLSQAGIQHIKFQGRPLDGVYRLRIWDSPALQWQQLQDVQIVLNYEYWSQIVANGTTPGH